MYTGTNARGRWTVRSVALCLAGTTLTLSSESIGAFSGTVLRTTCPSHNLYTDTFVNTDASNSDGGCWMTLPAGSSGGSLVFTNTPVERSGTQTSANAEVRFRGVSAAQSGTVCATFSTFNASGIRVGQTTSCNSGYGGLLATVGTVLTTDAVTLPASGTVNLVVGVSCPGFNCTSGLTVRGVGWRFTSNGT